MTVHPTAAGWVYFRGVYTGEHTQNPTAAVRSDNGRALNVEYNVWVEQLDGDDVYLQILDHVDTAGVSLTYDITFVKGNQHKPQFQRSEYTLNVSEATAPGVELLRVEAADLDPDQYLTYSIGHDSDDKFPFAINATTGSLRVARALDREDTDVYTFDVIATDSGSPERKAAASVLVRVEDVNDNAPVFADIPNEISVEKSVRQGYVMLTVSATDPDEGRNGVVSVELVSFTDLFAFNSTSGVMSVLASLWNKTGGHTVTFRARDKGTPQKSTDTSVTIKVVSDNISPPTFDRTEYTFEIPESDREGIYVGRISAVDGDGESVEYDFVHEPGVALPFAVERRRGDIKSVTTLDRESHSNYTFLVMATDDGGLPTGPKTSTATVHVIVADVNDNAPVFASDTFSVSVDENVAANTVIFRTSALDPDAGVNGSISEYFLTLRTPKEAVFVMVMDGDQVSVRTSKKIDAETLAAEIPLYLGAVDGGSPSLTSTTTIVVTVVDLNDNPPKFADDSVDIPLPRSTVQNTRIYSANATDDDVSEQHCMYKQHLYI